MVDQKVWDFLFVSVLEGGRGEGWVGLIIVFHQRIHTQLNILGGGGVCVHKNIK